MRRRRPLAALPLAGLALALPSAGCTTTSATVATEDSATCREFGGAVASPAYVDCLAQLEAQRRDDLVVARTLHQEQR